MKDNKNGAEDYELDNREQKKHDMVAETHKKNK